MATKNSNFRMIAAVAGFSLTAMSWMSCGLSGKSDLYADHDDVYTQRGRYVQGGTVATTSNTKSTIDTTEQDYYDPSYSGATAATNTRSTYDEDDYYYSNRMRRSGSCGNYGYYSPHYYTSPCYSCGGYGYNPYGNGYNNWGNNSWGYNPYGYNNWGY
ncbi:MAG TPA: hypothetical protein PK637_15485, partial [Flavobacteriales bacterium]|nr:hypothetical protein [Flavobacteriales bacterium]